MSLKEGGGPLLSARLHKYYLMDNETPSDAALTAVAAVVRFSDFAMRVVPAFAFAIVFSTRTSSRVHVRRVIFFLANSRISVPNRMGAAFYRRNAAATS